MAFFLEGEFTLLVIVLVLSSTTILASLWLRALAVVRGVKSACGNEWLFTFPLFLGILAVSLDQACVDVRVTGVTGVVERGRVLVVNV